MCIRDSRCLTCQDICEICTEVCPNRANVAITVPGLSDPKQIVHIDGLCNECDTCGLFCPHAGLPYKEKITVFWTEEDFADSTDVYKRQAQDRSIFGINERFFWRPEPGRLVTDAFGDKLAAPIGPAAGPSTQLANNIVACYLTGARFMELKTVPIMDGEQIRHAVAKPCIEVTDEGYNCEWSTELTVQQAYDEYLKALSLIHI